MVCSLEEKPGFYFISSEGYCRLFSPTGEKNYRHIAWQNGPYNSWIFMEE